MRGTGGAAQTTTKLTPLEEKLMQFTRELKVYGIEGFRAFGAENEVYESKSIH
jgi:hypothetical protein